MACSGLGVSLWGGTVRSISILEACVNPGRPELEEYGSDDGVLGSEADSPEVAVG